MRLSECRVLCHATEINLDGRESASGLWSLGFHSINLADRTVTQLGVEYTDTYRKMDGRWWIAETRTIRTYCLIQQMDADGRSRVIAMGEPPAAYGNK